MITGGDRRQVPSSFAWYPEQSNGGMVSPTEASPAPWPDRRKTLSTKKPFHMDFSSKKENCTRHLSEHSDNAVNVGDNIVQKSPLLFQLLQTNPSKYNDAFLLSQQSKTTPRPTDEASFISTLPMPIPTETKYFNDDQILKLIEKKVVFFRAQMRAWKEKCASFKDSSNTELISNCSQQPTPSTSFDDHISEDNREKKASDGIRGSPEQSRVTDHGTAGILPSNSSLTWSFFDKNSQCITLPPGKDLCIAEDCTYSKDNYCPPLNSVLMDTASTHCSLSALKERINSLSNVETVHKETFVDSILQTYWNGKLDNVHLFTSTEYVQIMQEAAAICSKEESPVVLQARGSFATVQELVKHKPTLTLHHKPSSQDYSSTLRNFNPSLGSDKESHLHPVKNKIKAGDSVADSSKLSQHAPMASALETGESETVTKNPREKLPQMSTSSQDVRMHLSQCSKPKMDFADNSLGSDQEMKMEHEQQFMEGAKGKQVQTGELTTVKGLFDTMLERLGNPVYEDISDVEEDNGTQQTSTTSTSCLNKDIHEYHRPVHSSRHLANATLAENVDINLSTSQSPKVSIQLEDISDDEGPIPGNGSIPAEISRPPEQNCSLKGNSCAKYKTKQSAEPSSYWKLTCACPFLVEIGDRFEQRPCPKCAQGYVSPNREEPLPNQRADPLQTLGSGSGDCEDTVLASDSQHKTVMDPEYEEDEWFVVPLVASDVKLEGDIIVLDGTDDEETGLPLSHEPLNQPIQFCFEKIQEYDSFDTFVKLKSDEFNLKVPLEINNTAPSAQSPLPSSSFPRLEAVEEATSEPTSAPSVEAEDSCDTDDSSDYPIQTKPNYLAVSSRVKPPTPLRHASESVEEGEVARSSDTMLPGSPPSMSSKLYLPDLTSDEDEDKNTDIDTTVTFTTTKILHVDTSKMKESKKRCKKKRSKVRCIVSDSDDDDDDEKFNPGSNLKCSRNGSSEIRKGSSQQTLKPGSVQARHQKKDQIPSSVSSHLHQGQAAKRKSTSTNSTSDLITKRRRFSAEVAGNVVQATPQSILKKSGHKEGSTSGMNNGNANTQTAKTNASKTTNRNLVTRSLSQPSHSNSISTQDNALVPTKGKSVRGSPLNKTLSLNGEHYHASSLPGLSRSQPKPQTPTSPKTKQENSYSTVNSTPAKQRIVKEWAEEHVPSHVPPKRKKRSDERDASSHNGMANMANRRDHKPPPKRRNSHETAGQQRLNSNKRQRRNSQGTALMKKSFSDAVQLTQQTHRQASTEKNPEKRIAAERYKWRENAPINDFDWERERDSPELPKGRTEY